MLFKKERDLEFHDRLIEFLASPGKYLHIIDRNINVDHRKLPMLKKLYKMYDKEIPDLQIVSKINFLKIPPSTTGNLTYMSMIIDGNDIMWDISIKKRFFLYFLTWYLLEKQEEKNRRKRVKKEIKKLKLIKNNWRIKNEKYQ